MYIFNLSNNRNHGAPPVYDLGSDSIYDFWRERPPLLLWRAKTCFENQLMLLFISFRVGTSWCTLIFIELLCYDYVWRYVAQTVEPVTHPIDVYLCKRYVCSDCRAFVKIYTCLLRPLRIRCCYITNNTTVLVWLCNDV